MMYEHVALSSFPLK